MLDVVQIFDGILVQCGNCRELNKFDNPLPVHVYSLSILSENLF